MHLDETGLLKRMELLQVCIVITSLVTPTKLLCQAQLVLRRVTIWEYTILIYNPATLANSASYPQQDSKWVPANGTAVAGKVR